MDAEGVSRPKSLLAPAAELALVAAIIAVPLPIPTFIPLLILASVSLWMRSASWGQMVGSGEHFASDMAIGVAVGVVAQLGLWLLLGESLDLNTMPVVRGNISILISALIITWVGAAIASEMVFRGYLIRRVSDALGGLGGEFADADSPGTVTLATMSAALLFGWHVADGSLHTFFGGFFAGLGYGVLYFTRKSLILPIAVHGGFESTVLVLGYLRLT